MEPTQAATKFESLNRKRIERFSELFPTKNQSFLGLLPLLFHTNSEDLPGFMGQNVPAGIVDYQPTDSTLNAARKLHPAFQYKRHSLHQYPIQGLYLISENGFLNYPASAEFELWLIYTHPLAEDLFEQLRKKMMAIGEWAKAIGINLQTRLLNEDNLANTLDSFELDRFYHSGLILAGSQPLWWHTSPDEDQKQASVPDSAQQSPHHNVLNFGSISSIDEQALFNLASQYIHKAMEKDLQVGLDLMFLKNQFESYPTFPWLSHYLKQTLYNDDTSDYLSLDPNTLKLQLLTDILANDSSLLLAQQSFYALCEEQVSKIKSTSRYPWRYTFVKQRLDTWLWTDNFTRDFDKRFQSQYRQCSEEFKQISEQMSALLQALFTFAKHYKLQVQTSRIELDQQYQRLFEASADTIKCLPKQFLPKAHEESLYLYRHNSDAGWHINDQPIELPKQATLYQHPSLVNVLAWAINNHLLIGSTRLKVIDRTNKIATNLILELIQQLVHHSIDSETEHPDDALMQGKTASIQHILLFANIEYQPFQKLSQQGLHLFSLQSDPLNYANKKQSLIASVEGLIYSSWGQWHYFTYSGTTSPLQMISTLLRWNPAPTPAIKIICWCPSEHYGKNISDRLQSLFTQIIGHFNKNPLTGEYLISIAEQSYKLQWQEGSYDYTPLSKHKSLFQHLAHAEPDFIASQVDFSLDNDSLLNTLFSQQSEGCISLFLNKQKQYTILYILNEFGSLYKLHISGLTETTLVSHFQQFFNEMKTATEIKNIQFFRLKNNNTTWQMSKISAKTNSVKQTYLPVIVELGSIDELASCTIQCGTKIFKGLANDMLLFKQVGNLIIDLRKAQNHYPLYISQLSFREKHQYSSHQYIIQKQRLEYLLNKI